MRFPCGHLAYCTNIHPAESWEATRRVLDEHTLAVKDRVTQASEPYAIGLRLSARAARELLGGDELGRFRDWLQEKNCYVFTINGFPYGDFHGTRVKENVYLPDWTSPDRIEYTKELFTILSEICPVATGGSVSTLPGSFKPFAADEEIIRSNLVELADFIDALSEVSGRDLHLGLEPEPLGHFENTDETLRFFDRLLDQGPHSERVKQRIGINYDSCHFALQYEDPRRSLGAFASEGLRISKIHLSAAVALDPRVSGSIDAIRAFDEPTYLHQVIERHPDGQLTRHADLPDGLAALEAGSDAEQWRIHFHIPLDAQPAEPLRSTRQHVVDTLAWCREHPDHCTHFEIETYTWGVLPADLHRDVEDQIAAEYRWVGQSI